MIRSIDGKRYNGFKLISLNLKQNALMGKSDLFYDFIDGEDIQTEIYTTVLIGANGTGKSNLFRIIIEILKKLYDLSLNKPISYNVDGIFKLKFSMNENIYEYGNMMKTDVKFKFEHDSEDFPVFRREKIPVYILRNNEEIEFDQVQLPMAIVANSFMLTDKYPFFKKEMDENEEKSKAFPIYKYLGVRNIAQSASTGAYLRKTVEFIVELKDSNAFRDGLVKATRFLGLEEAIGIFYKTSYTHKFFMGKLTSALFKEYFDKIQVKYSNTKNRPPDKLTNYLKISEDEILIENICSFCNELVSGNRLLDMDKSTIKSLNYNIMDNLSFEQLQKDFNMLEYLRQLGMIYSPEIMLNGKEGFSLQESSSGEYHFFSSIIGLMATVKSNSLVFIDEPEISLHPNWQMKYLSFIRELFSSPEFATSHILIATHSHFLVSDLKGESSKIIGLKKGGGKIQIVDLPVNIDTYGWSAEDVLYNVFNVVSTRNKFVAEDISNILNELSYGEKDKINKMTKEKYDEILNLESALKESDPLKSVVKSILKQIKS